MVTPDVGITITCTATATSMAGRSLTRTSLGTTGWGPTVPVTVPFGQGSLISTSYFGHQVQTWDNLWGVVVERPPPLPPTVTSGRMTVTPGTLVWTRIPRTPPRTTTPRGGPEWITVVVESRPPPPRTPMESGSTTGPLGPTVTVVNGTDGLRSARPIHVGHTQNKGGPDSGRPGRPTWSHSHSDHPQFRPTTRQTCPSTRLGIKEVGSLLTSTSETVHEGLDFLLLPSESDLPRLS